MKDFIKNITGSLKFGDGGWSARKLSAFAVMLCVVAAHVKWMALGNFDQLELVLTIDYGFVAGLLGMTTYETIQTKKEENKQTNIQNEKVD